MSECLFCKFQKTEQRNIEMENNAAYAVFDGHPVTDKHILVIPKRHAEDFFELTSEEILACNELILILKDKILASDPSVSGFNIGINCGETAGQSIFHCHIHLIPRRKGDVENPRGGVRHVIPEKGNY